MSDYSRSHECLVVISKEELENTCHPKRPPIYLMRRAWKRSIIKDSPLPPGWNILPPKKYLQMTLDGGMIIGKIIFHDDPSFM